MVNDHKNLEQEQLVGYWITRWGLKRHDLVQHPCIDDLILLIKYRQECWHRLNKSEQAVWGALWGYTYTKRKPLKNKSLKKLEQIHITSHNRHLQEIYKKTQQRKRIQALKQNPYSKGEHDMTAKGSPIAQDIPWN